MGRIADIDDRGALAVRRDRVIGARIRENGDVPATGSAGGVAAGEAVGRAGADRGVVADIVISVVGTVYAVHDIVKARAGKVVRGAIDDAAKARGGYSAGAEIDDVADILRCAVGAIDVFVIGHHDATVTERGELVERSRARIEIWSDFRAGAGV